MERESPKLDYLLGEKVDHFQSLSPDAWYVTTQDGTELVVKGVPRQEKRSWIPGTPWAELVVLDLLGAEGGPVPAVIAADLNNGYVVMKFVRGRSLRQVAKDQGPRAVQSLATSLTKIESILEQEQTMLAPYIATTGEADAGLIHRIARFLNPSAREAWLLLINEGFPPGESYLTLGSVDVQPDNALLVDGTHVVVLDFATIGWQDRERRIVGYVHSLQPFVGTLLDEEAYATYERHRGRSAAIRLVLYDFVYTLKMFEIVMSARTQNDLALDEKVTDLWKRQRMDHPAIDAVRHGLQRQALEEFADI